MIKPSKTMKSTWSGLGSGIASQVQMRIVVADNGYTNFLQGSQEDPKMVIQDVTIQVEAVNDMPYLSWLHLPPKDGNPWGRRARNSGMI